MRNPKQFFLLSTLLLAPALASGAAQAEAVNGDCAVNKISVSASDLQNSTTNSTTAVNVPEAVIKFTQKGKASCVVVEFFANTFETPGEILFVTALLDGVSMAPNAVALSSDSDENANGNGSVAHAFSWVGVAPTGAHVVQIQYGSQKGTAVIINKHTTLVHHR